MSKARERHKKRRERQAMVSKGSLPNSQIARKRRVEVPRLHIPGLRWIVFGGIAIVTTVAVIFVLALINPPETDNAHHAMWLNSQWAYQDHSEAEIVQLANDFREHQIGKVFMFTSSLLPDNSWSGVTTELNRFSEVEQGIRNKIEILRANNDSLEIYAWIEISLIDRIGETEVQDTIATFSKRMIERLGFDGVLLDVKPLFEENEDYIQLLRTVKRELGFDANIPLLVAVPPDLAPSGTQLNLPDRIAPGTEWTAEYKQRVALLANQIIIGAYNSRQTDPVSYIEWVTYQLDSYVEALSERDSDTTIIISIPLYETRLPAHDAEIETLTAALDGVRRSVDSMDELMRAYFDGVAIFTDRSLNDADWAIFDSKRVNP